MQIFKPILLTLLLFANLNAIVKAQESEKIPFFQPADTFNKGRFWTSAAIGATAYTGLMIGLNEAWYADYERSEFHLFNDWGEWNNMDKMGHWYTAYTYSNWAFQGAKWTGMNRRKAMWTGAGIGFFLQFSLEILDGYSEKWGFSMADMAFNTIGCAMMVSQELAWKEQRIVMKMSSFPTDYPATTIYSVDGGNTTTLQKRAHSLFGETSLERFLKDYNKQTIWASVNVYSFMKNKERKFPKWLNIAVGYGSDNMYGGFENEWFEEDVFYKLDDSEYPRYRQFYLSLDLDLTRIKTKSHFLKTLLFLLNTIKVPAPAVEFNTLGKVRFYPVYF